MPPLRRILVLLALLVVFAAGLAYLGLRHYVWPRLDQWRPQLEEKLGQALGQPVTIGRLVTGFDGLLPSLRLERLRVDDAQGATVLEVASVTALLSPRTLLAGAPRLASLEIDAPVLRAERLAPGVFRVAGLTIDAAAPGDGAALDWLAAQRRVLVHAATVDWQDAVLGVQRRVEGVDLALGTVGRRHRLRLQAAAQAGVWQALQFSAEFHRAPRTLLGDWRRWEGEAYVDLLSVDAAGLQPLLAPGLLPLTSARGDARAWLEFEGGQARRMDVKALLEDVDARVGERSLRLSALDTEFTLRQGPEGQALTVQRLHAVDPDGLVLATRGEQRVGFDAAWRPVSGRLALAPFEAADALAFAQRMPLPPPVLEQLDVLRAAGRIEAASGEWEDAGAAGFAVALDFDDLMLRYAPPSGPWSALPWFSGLSGRARITQAGGELRVRATQATLAFPGIFKEPEIPLDSVVAQAAWRVDPAEGVSVELTELQFENADAAGAVQGHWRSGGKGAGRVDLEGRLHRARADRTVRYLPLQIPAEVRDWVGAAVVGGQSDAVRFRLRGDLADFPFERPEDGEFVVDAALTRTGLRYAPDWPAIEGFDGRLLFERNGMRVSMRSGRVFGVTLGQTEAVIQDFDRPRLVVEGAGQGPAGDMIRFVNESPLATRIDDFTRDAAASGTARLALRLELPLDDLEATRVAGRVRFVDSTLTLDAALPPFTAVNGVLAFSERGLALQDFTGRFLGGPVRVSGETGAPGRLEIRGEGRIDAQGLRSLFDHPLTAALSGETGYQVRIALDRRAPTVAIDSELDGLASSLPAPMSKTAEQRMPLRVRSSPQATDAADGRPAADTIQASLGSSLRLALERARDPATQTLQVRRAALALGTEPLLPAQGLAVQLVAPSVDLDAWTPLLTQSQRSSAGAAQPDAAPGMGAPRAAFDLRPQTVSVRTESLRVSGRTLNAVSLDAARVDGLWRADIASREVEGQFNWREAAPGQRSGTLGGRFTRLEIARADVGEVESLLDASPAQLPGLDITAERFVLFDRPLGRLELRAVNSAAGTRPIWTLERLRLDHPSALLEGRGSWASPGFGRVRSTRMEFDLALRDSGQLLDLFGVRDAVRGGAGQVRGDLHWSGSPLALDYATLGGSMALDVGKGQFLKTDPGIAKLIGVLNLQSLPRRLALDFRDVFAEGFAFDGLTGTVGIAGGVARTDNLAMRGVQARVDIRGSANLRDETQDLEVEVRPELNAGLASLAWGAMVSPVVGIGSLVAQMALRDPIGQIFSYEYHITGPWADPTVVERRRRADPAAPPAATP